MGQGNTHDKQDIEIDNIEMVNKSEHGIQLWVRYKPLHFDSHTTRYNGNISNSVVLSTGGYRLFEKPLEIFIITEDYLVLLWDDKQFKEDGFPVDPVYYMKYKVVMEKAEYVTILNRIKLTFYDK